MIIQLEASLLILGILFFIFVPMIYFSDKYLAIINDDNQTVMTRKSSKIVTIFSMSQNDKKSSNKRKGFFQKICDVLCNKLFIFVTMSRIVLLGLNSILFFWLPTYMTDVIEIIDPKERLMVFMMIILCAPIISGVVSNLITYEIEGYESKFALLMCLMLNILSTCAFIVLPYITEWYSFVVCVMIIAIGLNAILPILNGIIITSMPLDLKSIAYTISALASTLFGLGPAAPLYGLIYSYTIDIDTTYAMKGVSYVSIIAVFFLLLAIITKHYIHSSEDSDKKSKGLVEEAEVKPNQRGSHVSNSINNNNDIMNNGGIYIEVSEDSDASENVINLSDFK